MRLRRIRGHQEGLPRKMYIEVPRQKNPSRAPTMKIPDPFQGDDTAATGAVGAEDAAAGVVGVGIDAPATPGAGAATPGTAPAEGCAAGTPALARIGVDEVG
jgi:hypothetical protein